MTKSKQSLRQEIMTSRLAMPEFARSTKTERISLSLRRFYPWDKVKNLHVYESIEDLNEVGTKSFIAYIQKQYPSIEICTARKIKNEWVNVSLDNKPAIGVEFDAVVIPMLGFDDSLNRLGYGGGFYDRFLSDKSSASKIGLCFEIGHINTMPLQSHDIPMDFIVSENRIYHSDSILEGIDD